MRRDLYILTTLSNLHAGSGDINFDIIDNQVQRDPITNLPVIHSSSLKGAFREAAGKHSNYTKYIFGPENSENDHQTGAFHFFEASLLSRPVRSNKKPYFMATSPGVLKAFLAQIDDFAISIEEELASALRHLSGMEVKSGQPLIFEAIEGVVLEELTAKSVTDDLSVATSLLGENIALVSDDDFKMLDLPVLARNQLENGISKNLWYEEVVPKQTRFYFVIAKPDNLDDADKHGKIEAFEKRFENNTIVQFGANKSIGYGYSKIKKVSL